MILGTHPSSLNATAAILPPNPPHLRVTTLCIFRLCFGYRTTFLPSSNGAIPTRTDLLSALVVISTAFLLVFLLATLLLFLIEAIRNSSLVQYIPTFISSSQSNCNQTSKLVNPLMLYDHLTAESPLLPATQTSATCTICLEQFDQSSVTRCLPCSHVFHAACIDRWLLHTITNPSSTQAVPPRCPVCNTHVLPCSTPHPKTDI